MCLPGAARPPRHPEDKPSRRLCPDSSALGCPCVLPLPPEQTKLYLHSLADGGEAESCNNMVLFFFNKKWAFGK